MPETHLDLKNKSKSYFQLILLNKLLISVKKPEVINLFVFERDFLAEAVVFLGVILKSSSILFLFVDNSLKSSFNSSNPTIFVSHLKHCSFENYLDHRLELFSILFFSKAKAVDVAWFWRVELDEF